MPICSYLVIPQPGAQEVLARRFNELPGCEVDRAQAGELLLLITDTGSWQDDEELRTRIESWPELQALILTFGEIDPETDLSDPLAISRLRPAGLPVLGHASEEEPSHGPVEGGEGIEP